MPVDTHFIRTKIDGNDFGRNDFGSAVVEFLKQIIAKAILLRIDHDIEALPLTQDFDGLYVDDCSSVRLPIRFVAIRPRRISYDNCWKGFISKRNKKESERGAKAFARMDRDGDEPS